MPTARIIEMRQFNILYLGVKTHLAIIQCYYHKIIFNSGDAEGVVRLPAAARAEVSTSFGLMYAEPNHERYSTIFGAD